MKLYFNVTLLTLLSQSALKASANPNIPSNNGNANGNGNGNGNGNDKNGGNNGKGGNNKTNNGRRVGKLGSKTSRGASAADCAKGIDIQLSFENDDDNGLDDTPSTIIKFKPDMKACKSGRSYIGSSENGRKHITLVPSGRGGGGQQGQGGQNNSDDKFAASVTDDETGAVYSISPDANGDMMVVERMQEDYGAELDPEDGLDPRERALLEESFQSDSSSKPNIGGGVSGGLRGLRSKPLVDDDAMKHHRNLQSSEMDILVVWTQKAECANSNAAAGCELTSQTLSNMQGRINLAIQESNAAYNLSGVNAQLRLVHSYRDTTGYVEPGFSTALNQITNTNDGILDDVHDKRTQYGADLVALIIDDPQFCGIAWLGPTKGNMFSVTAWNCATGYYSFGHEIGHNLGCNHDKGTSGACNSSNYNYGWRDPQSEFRSILAYNCGSNQCPGEGTGSCTRVNRFSNDQFLYNNKAMGSGTVNNAKRINDVAGTVAGYYTAPGSPTPLPTPLPITPLPTKNPTPPPNPCPEKTLEVEITLDNWAGETNWVLTNTCDGQEVGSQLSGHYSSANTMYKDSFCVPDADAQYEFVINDDYGDGLCCQYGDGGYKVRQDGAVMIEGGVFASTETKTFGLCASSPTPPPTNPSPTKNPTPNPTTNPTLAPTTPKPTPNPTTSPTPNPTSNPTLNPTSNPTSSSKKPTDSPSESPSKKPTASPTDSPTKKPSASPSESPTKKPSVSPTENPTASPTDSPTSNPTLNPTGPAPCQDFVVEVTTDNYPQESSWVLTNECSEGIQAQETSYSGPKTTTVCIPQGAYKFEFFDSYGDGICCGVGNGSYRVILGGNEIIASTGNFGSSEVTSFGSCAGVPTKSPVTSPPTPSPLPIEPTITASYDSELGAPRCANIGGACTSGPDLVKSRSTIAAAQEPNHPNTIDGCADGASGSYQGDEHNDMITISAAGGGLLTTGGKAVIQAKVYAYSNGANDFADFYYTDNVNTPDWKVVSIGIPAVGGGEQTITSDEFILPGSAVQAVRVNFRYNGSPDPCTSGSYNDRDDLVYAVLVADAAGPSKRPGPINPRPVVPQPSVDCESIGTDKKRCAEVSSSCTWVNGKNKGCYMM